MEMYEGVEVYSHTFLTSALEGGVVNFTPRPLYPQEKTPRYPFDRRLRGTQNRYGRGGEETNFCPAPSGSRISIV
jgi:hypothetical protein